VLSNSFNDWFIMKLTDRALAGGIVRTGKFLSTLILEVRFRVGLSVRVSQVTVKRIMQLGFLMYVVAKLLMRSTSPLFPVAPHVRNQPYKNTGHI